MGLFGTSKTKLQLLQKDALITELEKSVDLSKAKTQALITVGRTQALDLVQRQLAQITGHMAGVPQFNYNLETYMQEGYIENPHMHTVTNKIARPLKSIPWYTYEVKDKKQLNRYKSFQKEGRFEEAEHMQSKALEMVDGTPMDYMFTEQVNPGQTWSDFIEFCELYFQNSGNEFVYAPILSGLNYVTEMWCLPAHIIEVVPGDWMQPVAGYQIAMGSRILKSFNPEHIVHSKMFNPNFGMTTGQMDMLYGLSPMATLGRVVKRSNQSYLRSLYLLLNGGPPGIINEDGNDVGNMDPDKMLEAYLAKFGGAENSGIPMFAPANLKYTPMGTDSAGLQIIETNKADLEDVARVYDVPALLLRTDTVTRDNYIAAERQCWLGPRVAALTRRREWFNRRITRLYNNAVGREYWCDYDLKVVPELAEDKNEKSEMLLKQMSYGIWTGNEVREKLDEPVDLDNELLNQRLLSVGLKYSDVTDVPESFRTFISIINSLSPLVANNVIGAMSESELRELVGMKELPAGVQTINSLIASRGISPNQYDQEGKPREDKPKPSEDAN